LARATLPESDHGKTLDLSNAQIGIPFADQFQTAVGMTQELGTQSEISAKPIERKSCADKFLVRGWYTR
jgi:hypothetical protein